MRGCSAARMRDARPDDVSGSMRVKTAVCGIPPRSVAVRAALEKTSVAVTIVRFYWPVRSREGEGSMERDNPVECNGQEMLLLGMHAAEPQGGPGAAAPRRVLGTFPR